VQDQTKIARRKFLRKVAIGSAVIGASALGLYGLNDSWSSGQGNTSRSASSTSSQAGSTATTSQTMPLAIKDLNEPVMAQFNDFGSIFGNIDLDRTSLLKQGSETYAKAKASAENLRNALKNYKPQNTETEGQVRRLDEIALAGLYIYDWTSRMLEEDLNVADIVPGPFKPYDVTSSIGNNLHSIRYPARQLYSQLGSEINPSKEYAQNAGSVFTDINVETAISPEYRTDLKSLYDWLSPDSRARLKKFLESYTPQVGALNDYKEISEDQLGIMNLNILLSKMTDNNQKDIVTLIDNADKRGDSSLGKIASRANMIIDERIAALQSNYSQYVDSVYSELPSNHTELNDYDFAVAVMKTHTFLTERKVGYPNNAWDTEFRLERIFYGVAALADRDAYKLSVHPWGSDETFVDHRAAIAQSGKYYVTSVHGGRAAYTAEQLGPPLLYDVSDRNWGYTGYRAYNFIIIAKSLFGTINSIPVFVYNPEKGVVLGNQ
jgi:hypothetical protein